MSSTDRDWPNTKIIIKSGNKKHVEKREKTEKYFGDFSRQQFLGVQNWISVEYFCSQSFQFSGRVVFNLFSFCSSPYQNSHIISITESKRKVLISAHMRALVSATSCEDKSHRVIWPFLLQNPVAGTNFGPATSPTNSNRFELNFWDKSVRLVLQNAGFAWTVCGTSRCDQSLHENSSGD